MSQSNVPATKPHSRPTPDPVLRTLTLPTVDDLVDKIIELIPADMLAVAIKALAERTRERLSVQQIRKRLEDNAWQIISGRLDDFREELREELEEELRDLALSLADEDGETAIDEGELDDFLYDLANSTVQDELK
jgi:hypothetical protein